MDAAREHVVHNFRCQDMTANFKYHVTMLQSRIAPQAGSAAENTWYLAGKLATVRIQDVLAR